MTQPHISLANEFTLYSKLLTSITSSHLWRYYLPIKSPLKYFVFPGTQQFRWASTRGLSAINMLLYTVLIFDDTATFLISIFRAVQAFFNVLCECVLIPLIFWGKILF